MKAHFMWDRILQLLPVGCRHRHMSLPFSSASPARKSSDGLWERVSSEASHPYVVCLDCGKHFDYDWSRMRVVK
jgi:hypothetical protein